MKRHDPYCFCTDCCESREEMGDDHDYDEWRLAFPALPWNDEVPVKEMTEARLKFLREVGSKERGLYAVDYYPPAKWAVSKGYVEVRTGNHHFITEEGKAALLRAGEA